jgi:hypothetical protein
MVLDLTLRNARAEGVRFLTRSRVFTDEEVAELEASSRTAVARGLIFNAS